jgi:hypothetical protein
MDRVIAAVASILAASPSRWAELARSVPRDLLERPPAAGEWSLAQCLQHVLDTERAVFPPRVVALLEGRDFPAFDPDADGDVGRPEAPPGGLAAEFGRLRASSLALLDGLAAADLERRARHAELGPVTMRELLNQWAGHDLMHLVQGERALMQTFVAGSGPWRHYFADHEVTSG